MSAINLQRFISMCSSAAPGQLISKAGTRNSCKLKLGLTPGVAEQYQDRNEGLMPALHELPDKELEIWCAEFCCLAVFEVIRNVKGGSVSLGRHIRTRCGLNPSPALPDSASFHPFLKS